MWRVRRLALVRDADAIRRSRRVDADPGMDRVDVQQSASGAGLPRHWRHGRPGHVVAGRWGVVGATTAAALRCLTIGRYLPIKSRLTFELQSWGWLSCSASLTGRRSPT